MLRMALNQLGIEIESHGFLTLIDLYFFMSLVFNVYPFGSEKGPASQVSVRTCRSFEAYILRTLINFLLLMLFDVYRGEFNLPIKNDRDFITSGWMWKYFLTYIQFFSLPRWMIHYCKLIFAGYLDVGRDNRRMERMMGPEAELIQRDQNENFIDDDDDVIIMDYETEKSILVSEKN